MKSRKTKLLCGLAIGVLGLSVGGVLLAENGGHFVQQIAEANTAYELKLNGDCKPAGAVGATADNPASFTGYDGNANIGIDYAKVYPSTNGHINLAKGGNLASPNIKNITSIKVTFASGAPVLRFGLSEEDHCIQLVSGKTYEIKGNWFMVRGDLLNQYVTTDVVVEIKYPCDKEKVAHADNTYFKEEFNSEASMYDKVVVDQRSSCVDYKVEDGKLKANLGGQTKQMNYVNTYGKFSGNYNYGFKIKFADANTTRFMVLLGKSTYETTYDTISKDATKGTSLELTSTWARSNGTKLITGLTFADKNSAEVEYKFNVNNGHIKIYENGILKTTFDDKTYVTDGYISIASASSGGGNFIIDDIYVDDGMTFAYDFNNGQMGEALTFHARSGSTCAVTEGKLNCNIGVGDNITTTNKYTNFDLKMDVKSTADGKFTLAFGAPDWNKGFADGANTTACDVQLVFRPNLVRLYDHGGALQDTAATLNSQNGYENVEVIANGTSLVVKIAGQAVLNKTLTSAVGEGYIVLTRGTANPTTLSFDNFAVTKL